MHALVDVQLVLILVVGNAVHVHHNVLLDVNLHVTLIVLTYVNKVVLKIVSIHVLNYVEAVQIYAIHV